MAATVAGSGAGVSSVSRGAGGGGPGGGSRWFFTREQLENTPSRRSGVEADKELSYRQQAANLIQDMGQRLNVYPSTLRRGDRAGRGVLPASPEPEAWSEAVAPPSFPSFLGDGGWEGAAGPPGNRQEEAGFVSGGSSALFALAAWPPPACVAAAASPLRIAD